MNPNSSIAVFAWTVSVALTAVASADTVTFDLDNVWLLPNITHPHESAQQMTGSFEWTYDADDFENGSGLFVELYTPWYNPGIENLNITAEPVSIEFSLKDNLDSLGFDLSMFFLGKFSPDLPVAIDLTRSKFNIQPSVSYKGHFTSGSIKPTAVPQPSSLSSLSSLCALGLAVFAMRYWGTRRTRKQKAA